ncbi:MAG: hypothetical protein OXF11_08405 [Deltaproteobacteria bacterium]|nr:hypothetical protein [Deltaproteobacteria bacterium]
MDTLTPIIMPFVAGIVGWMFICRFGFFIDTKLDDQLRNRIYELFSNADRNEWAEHFVSIFDRTFSSARNGRPRFWRSVLASLCAFAAVTVVCLVIRLTSVDATFKDLEALPWELFSLLVPYAVFVNVIGDYCSLWETRLIIGRMIMRKEGVFRSVLFIVDAFASFCIFVVGLVLGSATFLGYWVLAGGSRSFFDGGSWIGDVFSLTGEVLSYLFREGGVFFSDPDAIGSFFAICLYTTFFTSVWIWTFLLGVVLLPVFSQLWNAFNVKKYPVGAAMCVGGAAVGLVTTIMGLARSW